MEIYLIRHGETGGNVAHRHQAEDTPLTDHGVEQARAVAKKVRELKPTHLVTSPLVRAIETARVIGEEVDMVAETSPQFIELMRPKKMYGHYHKSLRSMFFYANWYLGRTNTGESYQALRERIAEAKAFFAQYPEDSRIAVVSHSVFINLFLAHLCDENPMTPLQAVKTFSGVLKMKNTELIPLIFNPEEKEGVCGWFRADS